MPMVRIEIDEWYPLFYWAEAQNGHPLYDVPQEVLDRYEAAHGEFVSAMHALRDIRYAEDDKRHKEKLIVDVLHPELRNKA
jgi:hypothetical protein